MSSHWFRAIVRAVVTIGSAVAVAIFLYRQRGLAAGFLAEAADANWYWIGVAFVAEMASMIPLAQAERIVLRVAGIEAPLGEMTAVTFASNAIASSVPGGAAVAQGYAFKRYKHFGAGDGEAAWAELSSGAIAFSALAAVALTGAILGVGRAAVVVIPILSVVLAGSLGAVALFRRPQVLCEVVEWIERKLPKRTGTDVAERLRAIANELGDIHPPFATWVAAYGLSILNWLLDVVCLAFTFIALDAPVPWGAIFLAFAGTKVVSNIGITPGGIGLVEGGMVATFVALGVDPGPAAATVVMYRGLTIVGLVGFGWVMVAYLSAHGRHPHDHHSANR